MKVKEIIKKDGSIAFRVNAYLGIDSLTGKQVRTTITANSPKMCDIKAKQAINKFIQNGSTVAREKVEFENFEQLALSWFDSYQLTVKANTVRVTNNFFRIYLLPVFGEYKIDKITPTLIQQTVNQWAKNANTAQLTNGKREKGKCKDFKLLLNLMKRILDYAVQLGIISSNPAIQVVAPKLKTRASKKIKYFDNDELKRFLLYLDNLPSTSENLMRSTLYKLLISTGLRIGEALALSWSDIDLKDKSIKVSKTMLQTNEVQDSAKTTESNRTVSIDDETAHLLREWKAKQQDVSKVISLNSNVSIFSIEGHQFTYARELTFLTQHFRNAGVKNIGFHGFRHTHASLLMNADVNPKEIQLRLGHADYNITMNTYSHLAEDKKKDTAEKFSSILKAL
ncbi:MULTISPECIES: site-specific integrase [unclassified Lactococcus]|uniref:tyrosine-type recombinase/integrase n=1 Tax=unclassified Lactococcus TaxID=2643510 RepID=UPI0011C711F1|nr:MULTISPECIES: site-specific integrase [unclassified Lactococcus]MQW23275.1 tyrosine-type recombinase/integrase [Lactococcus sp. dk101]TXK38058.1 site-specific integrase [Lactococcus sp. dk310]TXK49737.1 site-specific integrase [Lactococcus sp. dk322]